MMTSPVKVPLDALRERFGDRLQENVLMANYTTAHTGGRVDAMLPVNSANDLEQAARVLAELKIPFYILGSGSNVLVSDAGLNGVVLVNRAHNVKVDIHTDPPTVWAESGANLGGIARQVALRGLSGLEWASTIPGTIGGAIYGNAGAHGSDMKSNLLLAEILHLPDNREIWSGERLEYGYRTSVLKRNPGIAVILAARLKLNFSTPAQVQARMDANSTQRRRTQPPGASLGSMFKNPEGDFAGRLIEAAGLKGTRFGGAQISPIHANFFINNGQATSTDIWTLIQTARKAVKEQFGNQLDLEIELWGDFQELKD